MMSENPTDAHSDGSAPEYEPEDYDTGFLVAALLVYVAKGDGTITEMETEKMLALVEQRFALQSAEALALLTRAMAALADEPDLESLLRELGSTLSDPEKEEIAVMLLQVVAADGQRDAVEMEKMDMAAEIVGISPELMHSAFNRYFEETPQ